MIDETVERLEESDARIWRVGMLPNLTIELHQEALPDAVEQALDIGITDFYVCEDSFEEGVPGIAFQHDGMFHGVLFVPEEDEADDEEIANGLDEFVAGHEPEVDEEVEKLADELLEEYREYLSDDEIHRLENNRLHLRYGNLTRIRDRVQEEARVDEDMEEEAAEWLANHENFDHQCGRTDSEVMLEQLSDFEMEKIRPKKVHRRAKALLNLQ